MENSKELEKLIKRLVEIEQRRKEEAFTILQIAEKAEKEVKEKKN